MCLCRYTQFLSPKPQTRRKNKVREDTSWTNKTKPCQIIQFYVVETVRTDIPRKRPRGCAMTPMTLTIYRTSWARSKPNGGLQCLAAESVLKSLCRRALLTVDSSSSYHRVHRQIESADQHTQKGGGQIQRYTDRKTVGHTRQERDREVVKVGKQGERRQTSTNTNATRIYATTRDPATTTKTV